MTFSKCEYILGLISSHIENKGVVIMEKALGANIKEIREYRGLTQVHVSKELGYKSPSMLSEIESGKKGLDAEKIPQLAQILNVSINQIFFGINIHDSRIFCNEERGF